MHNDEDTEELLKKSQDWYDTCVKPQEMSPSVVERFSEMVSALKAREGLNPGIAAAEITLDDTGSVVPAPPFGPSTPQGDQGFRTNHGLDYNRTSRRSTSTESLTDFSTGKTTQMDPKPEEAASMSTQRGNPNEKMEDMIAEAAVNMINAMTKIMNSNQRRRSQQAEDVDEMIAPSAELSDRKREVLQKILSAALDQLSGTSDNTQASPHTTLDGEPDKKGWIQCEFCTKQTRLRCEMKKHKKRHERPYGCTFHKCNKTFGSKADWKRHENSQHFHLQSWRCTLQDATQSGLQCARLFYRQEVYVQHLKRYHHAGEEEVRAAICKNRIGRNGQSQFWCGFCRNIVPLKSQGLAAWNERFNHIDMEHFKKGERIGDWLLPSGHLTKDREREEEKARAMTDTNEGDSEPAVEDNSDDDSESSIYHSDSDGLQDEVAVVKQQHIPRFPFQQFEDCLPDRSSSITLYPSTGPTNLRKRKISTPQPALELYYDIHFEPVDFTRAMYIQDFSLRFRMVDAGFAVACLTR
ncbi:hypothetical protein EYZ11_007459 [Aspergillus tanneri]|uniref:C2H2-type domain-containing protein n=1 Tax=Aspergillus tanneri TaxID=1220188 RepID=A0A4S3JDB3_9EURO|nr:hypothetical protein EYZ11_007459 [Aspergillus tanneri]